MSNDDALDAEPDDEWDSEEWEEDWEEDGFALNPIVLFLESSLRTKLIIAGSVSIIIMLILASIVSDSIGLKSGVGDIEIQPLTGLEGQKPSDHTIDVKVYASAPFFGRLEKQGTYSVYYGNEKRTSGNFELNDQRQKTLNIDYEKFFVNNGKYTLKVEINDKIASFEMSLYKVANYTAAGINFDGSQPFDRYDTIVTNLIMKSNDTQNMLINPWGSGSIDVFYVDNDYQDGDADYWNDDSERGNENDWILKETISYTYSGNAGTFTYESDGSTETFSVSDITYSGALTLNTGYFYGDAGDYTMKIDFKNSLGDDDTTKNGRSIWKWFYICETDDDGNCE